MIYVCCDERRRTAIRNHKTLNGIDFIEVLDHGSPEEKLRQRTLLVRLLKAAPMPKAKNVIILGGERITPVKVLWAHQASAIPSALLTTAEQGFFAGLPEKQNVLVLRTDSSGDYSTYMLRLVASRTDPAPPADFDPLLARVDFSFKVECPTDFDCRPERVCPELPRAEPDINYLAKDYASFRRLMLDRMAYLMPQWRERSPADLGIALVELLAYVGDHLSYQQDAIATEAYLGTARRRISVRRHARLVDYAMHDGRNARAWVQVQVETDGVAVNKGTQLLSRLPARPVRIPLPSTAPLYDEVMREGPVVFETMHDTTLFQAHNRLPFYAWGDKECCLPRGATRATLKGHFDKLKPADILIFEEVLSPSTGRAEDADLTRRHAVRLVEVVFEDRGQPLVDKLDGTEITEIRWGLDDALPFPFCISARTDDEHGSVYVEDVSAARGNIVLADHGRTFAGEPLGTVPPPHLFVVPPPTADRCDPGERVAVPARFHPKLAHGPLTQSVPTDMAASAYAAMHLGMDKVEPAITLEGNVSWTPKRDLLASAAHHPDFVAEVEGDGTTAIRFGDDERGMRPQKDTVFTATYRVGNGIAGNVGAEALAHIVTDATGITAVRNPLPAAGGVEPETIAEVRNRAPYAFRVLERAVTEADCAEVSERHPQVQRAAATFRWTGSWHTVFVTIDRARGLPVDNEFESDMRRHLEAFRMAGYDLEIDAPRFVSLEVEMQVCVKPDYFRSNIKAALLEVFSNRLLADGRRGLFHPDNFTFGQPVYLSGLYAAAQAVPGVASAHITKFQRQGGLPDPKPLEDGRMEFGRVEIARLDNDRNFPERGVFRLELGGGK